MTCRPSCWNTPARLAEPRHGLRNEMPVAGNRQSLSGLCPWKEHRPVARLGGWTDPKPETCQIDVALLLRPEIVFRHIGEAMKHPHPERRANAVSGFLHHLPMQRGDGTFAGVDTAAGKLEFRPRAFLKRCQKPIAAVDDRINTGTRRIAAGRIGRLAETAVHDVSIVVFGTAKSYGSPAPG